MDLTLQHLLAWINTTKKCDYAEKEKRIFYLSNKYFSTVDTH